MRLAQRAAAWYLHFVLSLIKYTKKNNNNTDYLYVYNLCFIGKNKRLYNLYRRLQEQRCWPTDWLSDSANHALLTRKHKQLAECAVTDAAAAAFPLKAWDRGKSNTWPWTESRVREKQRCEVDFFSWRRLGNVRPQRACKTFWCYRSEILCARGNTAIRSGEHKWFIETSSKS